MRENETEMTEVLETPQEKLQRLQQLLAEGDEAALQDFLKHLHAADVADCLEQLSSEERSRVLFLLPPRTAAETIIELEEAVRSDLLDEMTHHQMADMVRELPSDDAVDLLEELDEDVADRIVAQLSARQQAIVEPLRQYEEDTAGGIMSTEMVRVREDATVGDVVDSIRELTPVEAGGIYHIYCVDALGRFLGEVPAMRLLTSPPETEMGKLMLPEPLTVHVDDHQENVKNQFEKYDVPALPVLDDRNRLVGIITHDDILDVAEEEAEQDMLHMAGTDAEEFASTSILRAAGVRARWLLPCLAGTFISAIIIFMLEPQLGTAALIVIPFIMPIAAMGGNAGVQTSTVIVRSLATSDSLTFRLMTAFKRESRIAVTLGIGAGIFATAGTSLVLYFNLFEADRIMPPVFNVAVSVGIAMMLAIFVSTSLGMTLPFLFRRIGIDPAIATGPLITTFNDAISTAIFMMISILLVASAIPVESAGETGPDNVHEQSPAQPELPANSSLIHQGTCLFQTAVL